MEISKTLFNELNNDEMQTVAGGLGPIFWLCAGVIAGYVGDGILINTTGKSGGEWISAGISWVKSWF